MPRGQIADAVIRVLELRSVRGTGGGPEKTILLGAALADRSRFAVTVCYLRDARDPLFRVDRRAETADLDYVEITEQYSFDARVWPKLRALVRDRRIDIVHAHEYKTDLLAGCCSLRAASFPSRRFTAGRGTRRASGGCTTRRQAGAGAVSAG